MDSILSTIKKLLGEPDPQDAFDMDIMVHINSALFSLEQMGIGRPGYFITGARDTWQDFFGFEQVPEAVKTLVYLKVRLIFDPPASSIVLESIKENIKELEWRLYTHEGQY